MSLTNWDVFTNSPDVIATLNIGTEIIFLTGTFSTPVLADTASLALLNISTTSGKRLNLQPKPSFGGASTCGKIRTIVRTNAALGVRAAGLYCMSGQPDLTSTGNCYLAYFHTLGFQFNFVIAKAIATGVNQIVSVALATSALTLWADDVPFTLEFEWNATGSSTVLDLRLGSALDFSDLSSLLSFVDNSSPFFSTFGEGLFLNDSSGIMKVQFDNTTIEKLTP